MAKYTFTAPIPNMSGMQRVIQIQDYALDAETFVKRLDEFCTQFHVQPNVVYYHTVQRSSAYKGTLVFQTVIAAGPVADARVYETEEAIWRHILN